MPGESTSARSARIEFVAQVAQIRTMADGGLRFVLDAAESDVMQAAQLMECKRAGVLLLVVATPLARQVRDEQARTVSRRAAKQRE